MADDSPALIVAPHPDDEALACAGVIIRKRSLGYPVYVAYLTDGGAGLPDHPRVDAEGLAAMRRREALDAMAILGLGGAELTFLGCKDGALDRLDGSTSEKMVKDIAALIRLFRPGEVFVTCRRDGSSEHDAVFPLVADAVAKSGLRVRVLEYAIWARWSPRRALALPFGLHRVWRAVVKGADRELKSRALAAYASQVSPVAPWTEAALSPDFVSLFSSGDEFFFET